MDQVSSLSNNFDFNSQAGVMALLASIRASALSPTEKNELRDLVFLYTNGGGDASVRITLEQKLKSANILRGVNSNITSKVSAPAPVLAFGSSRPSPVFKAPVNNVAPVAVPTPVPVAAPAPVYVAPTPAAVPVIPPPPFVVTPPAPVAVPVEVAPIPVSVPTPVPAAAQAPVYVAPAPAAAPIIPPAQVAPAPVLAPTPVAPIQTVPVSIPNSSYLDRIREIKTAVNSKVGNPVNLVDINNEVGREYMNALLEAMKGLSGGAAGQIDFAMKRLETAYQAVELAVAAYNNSSAAATPVIKTPQPVTANPVPVTAPVPAPVSVLAPVVQKPVAIPTLAPVPVPVQPISQTVQVPVVQNATTSSTAPVKEESVVSGYEINQAQAVEENLNPSIAEASKVLTPNDLPSASAITVEDDAEGLLTREIDDGLEQLLSDWSLFKKSGLFGTGPKGREHPLFKKVAELQIPLLLAGRFEGSSQDIKQSITDYMNGWRYEQGIIYEQGETFERYLRRVIRQILNLQKKRRPG